MFSAHFLPALIYCSHIGKIVANIKAKLSPTQSGIFRQTCSGSFLDFELVFKGALMGLQVPKIENF